MNSNDLDIVVPFYGPAQRLAQFNLPEKLKSNALLDALLANTDVDYRIILVLDGVGTDVVDVAKQWLKERWAGKPAIVARNSQHMGQADSVKTGITLSGGSPREYVAVIHPEVQIMDRNWLSKMTAPFKDVSCFISFADVLGAPVQTTPHPVPRTIHPSRGLVMLRRPKPEDIVTLNEVDPWKLTAAQVGRDSRKIYVVPSVKTKLHPIQHPKIKRITEGSKLEMVVER